MKTDKTKKKSTQAPWLAPALEYAADWLAFQMERYKQPGCSIAIAQGQELVMERAFGHADLRSGEALTPAHRFRIASHSKTFTAAGVMRLREEGRLGLDDPIGRYVQGLHPQLADARIAQLLSHGAGLTRDGADSGQFLDRRPFLSRAELRAELRLKPPLEPGIQLKYSNHGYGLLGLMIEEITGSDYCDWITRQVIEPAGLKQTVPDMPLLPGSAPMAKGHSTEFPFGTRLIVPGDNPCHAIAPAGGFVSTAADVARFFASLAPESPVSILSAASRREMVQRRWRDPVSLQPSYYGLGTMLSDPGPREWQGHTGGLQGFVSRTSRFPAAGFTISVLCNALDGLSYAWVDGAMSILAAFQQHGKPLPRLADWKGRWWSLWGASDLVPMGQTVFHVAPAMLLPFDGSNSELEISGRDRGLVRKTSGYNSIGQAVRRVRNPKGEPVELWIGGTQQLTREAMVAEATDRYRKVRRRA